MIVAEFIKGFTVGLEYTDEEPEYDLPFGIILHLGFVRLMYIR